MALFPAQTSIHALSPSSLSSLNFTNEVYELLAYPGKISLEKEEISPQKPSPDSIVGPLPDETLGYGRSYKDAHSRWTRAMKLTVTYLSILVCNCMKKHPRHLTGMSGVLCLQLMLLKMLTALFL